ncbi:MAG: ATP-binding protein [Phycisphaerales bacterium]
MTLIEYIWNFDIGIDTLIITPTIGVDPTNPGRIGANTALCFTLIGGALLIASILNPKRSWIGMIAGAVGALSIASIWGYISNMPGLSGWGEVLSGMAVHTSVCFVLTSASLYLVAFRMPGSSRTQNALLTPQSVAVPVMVFAICVSLAMSTGDRVKMNSFTEKTALIVSEYINETISKQLVTLERMGERWNENDGAFIESWYVDSLSYLEDYPEIESIQWIDNDNVVQAVAPLIGNESRIGFPSRFNPPANTHSKAERANSVIVTEYSNSTERSDQKLLVHIQVYKQDKVNGYLLTVMSADQIVTNALRLSTFQHDIAVLNDHSTIYASIDENDENLETDDKYMIESSIDSLLGNDLGWQVKLYPTQELIGSHMTGWPRATLFIGLLISATLAQLVHMLQVGSLARIKQSELIEEVKRQKKMVEEANRELTDSNKQMEEFTYTVSHDLKAPLITIQGYAGFLKQDIHDGNHSRTEDFADRITTATNRMSMTLSDLLELSRVGRDKNTFQTINTRELALDVIRQLKPQINESNTRVTVSQAMPNINGDKVRTSQVIQNLITNALKYARVDGQCCEIEINACLQEGMVCLSVSDNGPGIKPEYHSKIFGLFQRLDSQQEGTGIGLAIVNRVASLHGGSAWVESTPGSGATFSITLPAATSTSDSSKAA